MEYPIVPDHLTAILSKAGKPIAALLQIACGCFTAHDTIDEIVKVDNMIHKVPCCYR